jgi:hypothetical protein
VSFFPPFFFFSCQKSGCRAFYCATLSVLAQPRHKERLNNIHIVNNFFFSFFSSSIHKENLSAYFFTLKFLMSTAATQVLLAETWTEDVDPTGWWMSEKLDGVR